MQKRQASEGHFMADRQTVEKLPKFFSTYLVNMPKRASSVMALYRRIATTSVAENIRRKEISYLVSYQIQLDRKTSEDNRLTFFIKYCNIYIYYLNTQKKRLIFLFLHYNNEWLQ